MDNPKVTIELPDRWDQKALDAAIEGVMRWAYEQTGLNPDLLEEMVIEQVEQIGFMLSEEEKADDAEE